MFINEEGKLFGKISIVDLAVIICLAAAIIAVGLKFVLPGTHIGGSQFNCEYTVTVKNIRIESVNAIRESMKQNWHDVKGVDIGKIKEVISIEPYTGYVYGTNGSVTEAAVPDKYTIKFRMSSPAKKGNCAVMLGGKREIMNGSHLTVSSEEISLEALITDIEIKE